MSGQAPRLVVQDKVFSGTMTRLVPPVSARCRLSRSAAIVLLAACLCFAFALPGAADLPAFPGAEGFGSSSIGGRGGAVFVVTNLNDSGPGSLRTAVDAEGPRTVVFQIGGTIYLDSSLTILHPYITIAGQTAPGGGITLANSPRNFRTPLKIETHDVVVRYIRSRPGSNPAERGTLDALTVASKTNDVFNVVIDHCSLSWATDEVFNAYYAVHDITVQWSIIAEGLDCATHVELGQRQCHSMGMLLGSEGSGNFSIHHNLFAHNRHRNPKSRIQGLVDLVNNVVYNSGSGPGWRSPSYVNGELGNVAANYVSNFFKPGPDSGKAEWFVDTKSIASVYLFDNIAPGNVMRPDLADRRNVVPAPHQAPGVTTSPADQAFESVLAQAGAGLGLGCDGTAFQRRDAPDARVVGDVWTGGGKIIDHPSEVGGWPILPRGRPCPDRDRDGMPDQWELMQGLDPSDARDGAEVTAGGYTWLEIFLNSLPLTSQRHPQGSEFDACIRCRQTSRRVRPD